jgi:hypothetical protein
LKNSLPLNSVTFWLYQLKKQKNSPNCNIHASSALYLNLLTNKITLF